MAERNMREAYGRTLVDLGRDNPDIVVLEGDLGKSTMSCYFEAAFPERYFEMGIAEANMTSFAAGLSLTGKVAFTNSFAAFAAGRSFDQIRQSIALPGLNVKIVGSSAGLSDFGDGSTHQTVEDVAIMRAIPAMTVLVPADANEIRAMTRAIVDLPGPVYMRVTRSDVAEVTPADAPFVLGKPRLLRDGRDLVIFAMGVMVETALKAAETLATAGVSARVVNVSTLKPVDEAAIRAATEGMRGIVTVEEHSVIGGLAAVVREACFGVALPFAAVGIQDRFGQSAETIDRLYVEYGLTETDVVAAATALLRR